MSKENSSTEGLKHASLFSGIGGFDLAADWMGWENIFHCEINPFGQKILKYYWPNSVCYDDIKKTDFTQYRGLIVMRHPVTNNERPLYQLDYKNDWSFLMPVVEKLSAINLGDKVRFADRWYYHTFGLVDSKGKFIVTLSQNRVSLGMPRIYKGDTLIEAVYLSVLAFIQMYNQSIGNE